MMNKFVALGAAGTILAAGGVLAQNATALPSVGVAANISSATPVPGGFTAGSWAVSNTSTTETIPAGSTFLVTFSQLDESPTPSSFTVTPLDLRAKTMKVSNKDVRITLTKSLSPGQSVRGLWSDSHAFNIRLRDKVSIRLESTPGAADIDPSDDARTYDNNGRGF